MALSWGKRSWEKRPWGKEALGKGQKNNPVPSPPFDHPVILQRSPIASRLVIWGIVGFTSATLIWANFARIDEAVPATGNLTPQGAVRAVQLPLNGKVKDVFVKEGQIRKTGRFATHLGSVRRRSPTHRTQKNSRGDRRRNPTLPTSHGRNNGQL